MKQRWDEVQYAYGVPEKLRERIGQTPVFEAGKPLSFSGPVPVFGILAALLAAIMLGLAVAEAGTSDLGITLTGSVIGGLLGLLAWRIIVSWHRERSTIAACEREYQERSILCQACVVFFEMIGIGDGNDTDFYTYYQFQDDFVIKERMDNSNSRKTANEGEQIWVSYLPRDRRISRIATWK